MGTYRYLHWDVFTDRRFTGNQLAVFMDASGLDPAMMQRIAAEMAFSETAFLLPAETADTDIRMKIYTPGTELPMAGHPTIGATFALAHERRIKANQSRLVLGLGIGPTPVQLEWQSDTLSFAWMKQARPEFGPIISDIRRLATALGLKEDDIRKSNLPVQQVSSGVPMLFVPLASRQAVNTASLDRAALSGLYQAANMAELPVFLFSLETGDDDATVFSRMFAPVFGIPEDPATGGASGPLGGYLVQHQAVSASQAKHMISLQGAKMGRPSHIHISIRIQNGLIDEVYVGGQATFVGEGTIIV
jgi:trans-2,3-dihydro-3-hydroxyanthranilate isomerase